MMYVSGGVVSPSMIVQLYSTGVTSTFSEASVAKTRNVCGPRARPLYDFGGMQKVYAPPSSEHSHVVPSSLASNLKFATVLAVCGWFGPDRIVVTGGTVSGGCLTVQLVLAGVGSTKPCVSTPRTEKVCQPTVRPVSSTGETQVEYGALSSEHWWAVPVVLLKAMVAYVRNVSLAGAAVIVVSGGMTTVHCQTAGVGSKRPSLSSARTRSRCTPGPTPGSSRMWLAGCWTGKTIGLHSSNRSPSSE